MHIPSPPSIDRTLRGGFSLPEVAISLGIAATALLTLISMLPFGLNTLREAGNKQTESRILQSVIDGYQTGAWVSQDTNSGSSSNNSNAANPQDRTFFFDQTGTEIADGTSVDCNYVVRVLMGAAPSIQGDVSGNQYLRQLKVRITDRPTGHQETLANESTTASYHERSVWIALLDQTGPMASSTTAAAMNVTGL